MPDERVRRAEPAWARRAYTTTQRVAALLAALAASFLGGACFRLSYTGGARPLGARTLDDGWIQAAPTPVVRQRHQTDCGLAALAMIGGAWGRAWTVDELGREAHRTTTGVRLGALRDLARSRGLEAYAIRGTPEDLRRELSRGRPVMLG